MMWSTQADDYWLQVPNTYNHVSASDAHIMHPCGNQEIGLQTTGIVTWHARITLHSSIKLHSKICVSPMYHSRALVSIQYHQCLDWIGE